MVDTTKVILFKKEAVYGTDAAPTGAANAALTRNYTTKPMVTDRINRNIDRPIKGGSKDAPSNARKTFAYELELAGSGQAGVAPAWMEHLQCCGMAAPVLTAGASAVQAFAPVGAPLSAATVYDWHGNQRRIGLGARGTFGWDFTAGAYPFLKFDMTAMLPAANPVLDVAPPAIVLDQWRDPLEVNTANTEFLLDGYALVVKSFTGDVNWGVKYRNLVGASYVQLGNHAITGKIMGEAPLIASKNYFATLLTGQEITVQAVQGVGAGSIVQLDGAHLQITDIELSDEDGVLMVTISYRMNVGTTPDDLILTAK